MGFARLVDPVSWDFWDTPGVCGTPWTPLCKANPNLTMCELNLDGKKASWCPDPVAWQNVMYSGHLAHVGALYESLSGDKSLTSIGWDFYGPPNERRGVPPIRYTLETLLTSIHNQQILSRTGGFACEPTVVYLVCNQHTYTAEKLYDAIYQSSSNKRLTSEAKKWLHYLNTTAVRQKPIGPLGEGFFEILYQEQLKDLFGFNWVEIADVGGCAANDGWASTVMGFWAANDKGVGKDLVERVRSSIANNNGWVEVGKKTAEVEEKDHGVREATSGIIMKGQKGAGTGGEGREAGTGGAYLHHPR